jgi:hypothetical protein
MAGPRPLLHLSTCLAMLSLLASAPSAAPGDLQARYPVRGSLLVPEGGGLHRVELDARWIAACPDPTSYLLLDASGREVPYAIETSDDPTPPVISRIRWTPAESVGGWVYVAPGPEAEGRHPVRALRVRSLPEGVVARVDLDTAGHRRESFLVWNLPDTGAGVSTEIPLPPELREGPWVLSVTRLEGSFFTRRGPPLDFDAVLEDPQHLETLTLALPFEGPVPVDEGVSEAWIRLPRPGLPVRGLELDVVDEVFSRGITARSLRPGASTEGQRLGQGRLERLRRGEVLLARTALDLGGDAPGDLLLRFDDGRSPPLGLEGTRVRLRAAALLLPEARPGEHTLLACGKSGKSYDLDAMRARLRAMPLRVVTPSPPEANAAFSAREALGAASSPGPTPEGARFGVEREIRLDGGIELFRLPLDADVLARSREDFGDLRLLDARDRQVPFVLGRWGLPRPLEGLSWTAEEEARATVLRLDLGMDGLPVETLQLRTPRGDFSREVVLAGTRETLLRSPWTHEAEGPARLLLTPRRRLPRQLVVRVEHRDNAALPLDAPLVSLPAWSLWALHPGEGPLHLVYADPALSPPTYDLALLSQRILEQPSVEAALGPVKERATRVRTSRSGVILLGVLALSLALLFLVGRLLRRDAVDGT